MLDGLFGGDGLLHPQSQPHARLDLDPQVERLRVAAHHRVGRRPLGRGADPHRAHGRRGRARHRGALALQGRQPGGADQRNVAGTSARTDRGHDPRAGAAFRRQTRLGRNLRLHAQRRPAQTPRGGHAPRLRLRHPHLAGIDVRGRHGSTAAPCRSANSCATATSWRSLTQKNQTPKSDWLSLRGDLEGPQQDQVLPARGAGQAHAHGARGAGTQTQELEIRHHDRRGGGLPGQILQTAPRHGGLRADRHPEARLRVDQGDPLTPPFGRSRRGAPRRGRRNRTPEGRAARNAGEAPLRRTRW